jgi:hypothetical protein
MSKVHESTILRDPSHDNAGTKHPRHHSHPRSTANPSSSRKQVQRIKERVEEKEGIPPQQQRLIYGGKQM